MKKGKYNKTIESFMVIILMVIVLAAMVILMNSGRIAYSRILADGKSSENARTALSYINMKIRQNDRQGKIQFIEGYLDGMDVLEIEHSDGEEGMVTYIFYNGESLMELYTMEDIKADADNAMPVVNIDGIDFDMSESNDRLTVTVYYNTGKEQQKMQRVIGIRTVEE